MSMGQSLERLNALAQRCGSYLERSWRTRMRRGDVVSVLTRDGGLHWARCKVISARRQNVSVKFVAAERTDGEIHMILSRASCKLRKLQVLGEERLLSQKALALPWPHQRRLLPLRRACAQRLYGKLDGSGERHDADSVVHAWPSERRTPEAGQAGWSDVCSPLSNPGVMSSRGSFQRRAQEHMQADGACVEARLPFRVTAWEVPLARADKATLLIGVLQEEVRLRSAEVQALQQQRERLQRGDGVSLRGLRLLFCDEDPLDVGYARARPEHSAAGHEFWSNTYEFPLTSRDKLRRLVHLYHVELEHCGIEVQELRCENKALWNATSGAKKCNARDSISSTPPLPPNRWL